MPHEIIFVADAMTGQEAVNVAKGFNDRLESRSDVDKNGWRCPWRSCTFNQSNYPKTDKVYCCWEKLENLEAFHRSVLLREFWEWATCSH
ncbi:MAG: hypothetical protein Ct9H300mP28_33310 [Pseudomonadota bacterium]|nr:MAG: hypothetical protein Ct9H300mP28_33310 [Pseudomonadota bacterium]